MANAAVNRRLEAPELLLRDLKDTVAFLLDISVFKHTVFYLGSGLQLLHSRVKPILSHGTRVNHYLIFSQPSFATFDTWLQNSLQDHSLAHSLESDPIRLKGFYHEWAFVRNEKLYTALIDCLSALATRNFDVLIRIQLPSPALTTQDNRRTLKLPASGTPVIMESQPHKPKSRPSSRNSAAKSGSETSSVVTICSPKAVDISISVSSSRKEETDDIVSSSSSVPEFSYHGSPVSSDILTKYDPKSSHVERRDSTPVVFGGTTSVYNISPQPPKSFLESGFKVQPTALGSFPLPQKGQSVASFLISLSDTAMPELDRENAHFNVSEALISAFENVKVKQWNEELRRRQKEARIQTMFGEVASSSSSMSAPRKHFARRSTPLYSETESEDYSRRKPRRPPAQLLKKKPRKPHKLDSEGQTEGFASTTDVTPSSSSEDVASSSFSAEGIAMNLLRNVKVKDGHLADASELMWLVTEQDAPQALLPMPKSWNSASESDTESLDKSMRLRGTSDWAPPRPQIIFTEHPPPNLQSLLRKSKHLRCAGCGMRVEPKYASTFRYCHYLGRYFCTGCHSLKKARLPQRILNKWDFSPYHVSNFSYQLLESLQSDPVYNVMAINPNLYHQRRMQNFKNLRIQLNYLGEYLRNCKAATRLGEEFNNLPKYYTADVDLYSLEDLLDLRFGVGLPLKVKLLVSDSVNHVLKCQLCRQLGFHCEVCKKSDILFPFQISRVSRCRNCSACFHLKCFNPVMSDCPKCLRLSRRRSTQNLREDSSGVVLV